MKQEIFLINEIEMCREEMSRAARKNALTSKEVLQMSIRLDELMNEYENLKQKEQQPA
ncbi:aspartyl-phosphate phosphatase Spo0E family protein [Halobacillus halophilus]|uniref:aspartyl-phosphate phosphatase Spo0E family protein n=1 Tax=Halobacillus halophilus TaxID=1570 RepID=UPI001CD6B196|nr:aspartyl-phosphate phosphatase Spo0E family protein [Halobacillus halophilus]MCA1012522.1 aspartyl-phosphate phosphatase Spo0E family protein [Halobacillus halophilus]